jgi:hypothetical protein
MKIKTRIKMLAVLLLTSPASVVKASPVEAPLAGIPPVNPVYSIGNTFISILNIALIPLAVLTLIFYFVKNKTAQKGNGKKSKYQIFFKIFLILLIVGILLRIFVPIVFDYYL